MHAPINYSGFLGGMQAMYVLCYGQNHYCGGTSSGKKYWTEHPRIPEEFLLAVNEGIVYVLSLSCICILVTSI